MFPPGLIREPEDCRRIPRTCQCSVYCYSRFCLGGVGGMDLSGVRIAGAEEIVAKRVPLCDGMRPSVAFQRSTRPIDSKRPNVVSIQCIMPTPERSIPITPPLLPSASVPYTTASTSRLSMQPTFACCRVRFPGSVPGCGRGADAGLRPHLLCQKAVTVLCRLTASVKDREQPDTPDADRHREQGRRGIREQRAAFRIAQGRFPYRRRHNREQQR